MVRADARHWLKCGIELVDGVQHVSTVVTREYSDWSVVRLLDNPTALWLRLRRSGPAIEVQYALDGASYQLLRLAYLTLAASVRVGVMCASPQGQGYPVIFEDLTIRSE